jgi:hypothetical protein
MYYGENLIQGMFTEDKIIPQFIVGLGRKGPSIYRIESKTPWIDFFLD